MDNKDRKNEIIYTPTDTIVYSTKELQKVIDRILKRKAEKEKKENETG